MLRLIHYGSPAWLIAPVPERTRPPCIYSRHVCTHTRHGLPFCMHMLHILCEPLYSLQLQQPPLPRDVFTESTNYFAQSLVARNVVGLSGKWISILFRLAFSLVNGWANANLAEICRRLLKETLIVTSFFFFSLFCYLYTRIAKYRSG